MDTNQVQLTDRHTFEAISKTHCDKDDDNNDQGCEPPAFWLSRLQIKHASEIYKIILKPDAGTVQRGGAGLGALKVH